jgi:quercetin dioxygenase-like cupin family protein
MKKILLLFILTPLITFAQGAEYNIKSFLNPSVELSEKAPNTYYLGNAWLNRLIPADDDFNYNLTQATFSADSTLDWHKHSTGQVLIIIDGEGYYQERGKEVIVVKKGDVIKCDKNTEHWHSASHDSMVSYIAIYGASETIWTEKLSKIDYDKMKNN